MAPGKTDTENVSIYVCKTKNKYLVQTDVVSCMIFKKNRNLDEARNLNTDDLLISACVKGKLTLHSTFELFLDSGCLL